MSEDEQRTGDEPFLARWSRKKRSGAATPAQGRGQTPARTETPASVDPASGHVASRSVTPGDDAQPAPPPTPVSEAKVLTEADFADVDFEALGYGSDYARFMQDGVPEGIRQKALAKLPGYHASNLMIGTPEEVYDRIVAAQAKCSFSEIAIVPQFGTMPYEEAMASTRLFAAEVLPELHKMPAPLHPDVLPSGGGN